MARYKLDGAWSAAHECCVSCGRRDIPHTGRGLCRRCWKAQYYAANSERIRAVERDRKQRLDRAVQREYLRLWRAELRRLERQVRR